MNAPAGQELDQFDALAASDPKKIIALMLWKLRHRFPEMAMEITEKDIKGFNDCVAFLRVEPAVLIKRPGGVPAQEAQPAAGNRRAVPARAAIPPKDVVVVALVADGTENAIRAVENNVDDYQAGQDAQKVQSARERATELANRITSQANTGDVSLSDVRDAADALLLLAKAAA